jgi:hypothetical protein
MGKVGVLRIGSPSQSEEELSLRMTLSRTKTIEAVIKITELCS